MDDVRCDYCNENKLQDVENLCISLLILNADLLSLLMRCYLNQSNASYQCCVERMKVENKIICCVVGGGQTVRHYSLE